MEKVRIGIIGLGEVAQIVHLPILQSMPEKYEITAMCDLSLKLLTFMGEKYNVKKLYTNAEELTAQKDLDAVFILNANEYHAECAIAAARNKKHVLIEKPLCLTIEDADAIIKARDEAKVQVMVAYMRRFAPAFIQAVEEVKRIGKINYVRVRDIIGPNSYFINQTGYSYRFDDITQEQINDRNMRNKSMIEKAIGNIVPDLKNAYGLLCGLNSHDISAMREMIGTPKRVSGASQWNQGLFMNAIFEYDGYNATFETGVDNVGRFDAHIEVYGDTKSIKVQYDTPYIKNLPITLTINGTNGDAYQETVYRPTYKDPYTLEIEYFYDALTKGTRIKTTVEDAKEDLKVFKWMIEAMQK